MLTGFIDSKFPKWAKILLFIFTLGGMVYRVLTFVDDCIAKKDAKNVKALVVGIIGIVLSPLGFIMSIVDIFTGILKDGGKPTLLI